MEAKSVRLAMIMIAYLLLLLAGQLLWKAGLQGMPGVFSSGLGKAIVTLMGSVHILGGLALYALATLIWLYLLSRFDLSYIYPFVSLSFVLAVIVSVYVLGEDVSWNRWAGVVVIGFGVYLVSIK